jgi:hypothetical protein
MISGFRSHGIRINSYPVLKNVLKNWQNLNDSPEWLEDGDAPWWYNERASLSFFAGAIWLSSGWAFEEFSTDRTVTTKGKAKRKKGRLDIAFKIKDTFFLAEAKQCWPTLTGKNITNVSRYVTQTLDQACEEVRQVRERGYKYLGIAFVAPSIHESRKGNLEVLLAELIGRLLAIRGTTIAWTFPEIARELKPDNRRSSYIYPGTIVIIKKAG